MNSDSITFFDFLGGLVTSRGESVFSSGTGDELNVGEVLPSPIIFCNSRIQSIKASG